MRYFSYVVTRDFGFAPNPFYGTCTLATCKPRIRNSALPGNWVLGTGPTRFSLASNVIFAMKVAEAISFNEYWEDPRFRRKKPVMHGSLKQMYGDNIYHTTHGKWIQVDSHHSYEDGTTNPHNLERDTSADRVLISNEFFYFGRAAPPIPPKLITNIVKKGPGYRCPDARHGNELIDFLSQNYEHGYVADPLQFDQFKRYDGKS